MIPIFDGDARGVGRKLIELNAMVARAVAATVVVNLVPLACGTVAGLQPDP
ncbi:hypothetical protein ACLMAJ_22915 [Nocardia sp. KC 131]|uniref:hypothetical protein n=1 Tax=Nocardia arseniciresistens TaxID=3392119 RepID=UPI00398EE7E3